MGLDPDEDPFRPPAKPREVACLHCGRHYSSELIEWRIRRGADGAVMGFWCCPMSGCDGAGYEFDIYPVDEDGLAWFERDAAEDGEGEDDADWDDDWDEEEALGLGEDEDEEEGSGA
jgi:hypothetical protein